MWHSRSSTETVLRRAICLRRSCTHRSRTAATATAPWIPSYNGGGPSSYAPRYNSVRTVGTRTDGGVQPSRRDEVAPAGPALFDSLSERYRPIPLAPPPSPSAPEHDAPPGLAWYTCGPTVYDSAHLGHARTYVTLDIFRRLVTHLHFSSPTLSSSTAASPPPPVFVMNITDVDDKILQRAKEKGEDALSLARRYEREFWEDMEALNVRKPDVVTRVTEHVDCSIVPYIRQIVDNGMAYLVQERDSDGGGDGDGDGDNDGDEGSGRGSVYFDVGAFEAADGKLNKYGKLAPVEAAVVDEEGRDTSVFFQWGDDDTGKKKKKRGKRDPRDFVLWKSRMDGEEEELSWDSPWGRGRPGWHIECSAMIETFTKEFPSHKICVHAGGIDLKFPHHTNEIAQAEAYHSPNRIRCRDMNEWIPHWVHTGHLHIKGSKMSKSLKNFITIKSLLRPESHSDNDDGDDDSSSSSSPPPPPSSGIDSPADDFRLWCLGLSGSYREATTYSKKRLEEAKVTREKLLRFLMDGEDWITKSTDRGPPTRWGEGEHGLVEATDRCSSRCRRAIMGLASLHPVGDDAPPPEETKKNTGRFDMDGSTYLQSVLSIADRGNRYIHDNDPGRRPVEPLKRVLSDLRRHLSLVGFSDRTTGAGRTTGTADGGNRSDVVGGEAALVDELWKFRAEVRDAALASKRGGGGGASERGSELSEKILSICDGVRDDALPRIGVEMSDDDRGGGEAKWRFCLPRRGEEAGASSPVAVGTKRAAAVGKTTEGVGVVDMFTVGAYSGMFSKYDARGIPTHASDGSEVSKRLRKKLTKKMAKKENK